jgi:hypothetical protein
VSRQLTCTRQLKHSRGATPSYKLVFKCVGVSLDRAWLAFCPVGCSLRSSKFNRQNGHRCATRAALVLTSTSTIHTKLVTTLHGRSLPSKRASEPRWHHSHTSTQHLTECTEPVQPSWTSQIKFCVQKSGSSVRRARPARRAPWAEEAAPLPEPGRASRMRWWSSLIHRVRPPSKEQ